ncbi:MAG: hypothetical protein GEU81_17765 [Nitriliruptorales bacterium]|nr:hypothetical protein [Nitriliruptorales bacterium]
MPPSPLPPPADAPAVVRLGWALRRRREAMPGVRSRERLAERLGYSVAVIKDVENGVYRAGLHRFLTRWEQVFTLDPELQALWNQTRTEHTARRQRSIPAARHVLVGDEVDILTAVDQWELADALSRSSISPSALDYMERAVNGYAARYPSSSPGMLMPVVSAQLRRLRAALGEPQTLAVRRRVVQLVGTLLGIRGNLLLDLGHPHDAAEAFAVGKLAGAEADGQDLTAWVLATESIGLFFSGRYHQAVQLLEEAARRAKQRSSSRRRAWILALQARGYAALGDAGRALKRLDEASAVIAAAAVPYGADFFDTARLQGIAGTSSLLLRDAASADRLLTAALTRRAPSDVKGRALLILDVAACRLIEDEGDESFRLVEAALDLARGSVVKPIVIRAREVRVAVGRSASTTALAQLDHRLAQVRSDGDGGA